VPWQSDPIAPIRAAAAVTVAGRNRDAGIRQMAAEHGADLPAWWRADPSGDGDLPARYQTKDDHLVSVTALDVNGAIVKEQPLR